MDGMAEPELRCVIGVSASAGGIVALRAVVGELPPDLPAAVLVVLHIRAHGSSHLATILDRETPLQVMTAVDGEPLVAGRVHVAPPDRHLLVHADRLGLDAGPRENGFRPAADVLLRSLAAAHGPRAVAVILSGALADGAAGAASVRHAGGTVVVQDPGDAIVSGMPRSAIAAVAPDRIAPAAAIGSVLAGLAGRSPASAGVGGA
jgi:two-component system chemotaxis response regulator CheB